MNKTTTKLTAAALLAGIALPAMVPQAAQAQELCREYTRTVRIGGRVQQAYGTACRDEEGSWRIVNESNAPASTQDNVVFVNDRAPPPPQTVVVERRVYNEVDPWPFIAVGTLGWVWGHEWHGHRGYEGWGRPMHREWRGAHGWRH